MGDLNPTTLVVYYIYYPISTGIRDWGFGIRIPTESRVPSPESRPFQYLGWEGSTLSIQSRIPPLRFLTRLNPTDCRNSWALALRPPILQCATMSLSLGSSA